MLRGEIWLITLDPTVGAEIKKIRPAVIANDDEIGVLPLKLIVPITDWDERFARFIWMTKLIPDRENGLTRSLLLTRFRYGRYPSKDSFAGSAK